MRQSQFSQTGMPGFMGTCPTCGTVMASQPFGGQAGMQGIGTMGPGFGGQLPQPGFGAPMPWAQPGFFGQLPWQPGFFGPLPWQPGFFGQLPWQPGFGGFGGGQLQQMPPGFLGSQGFGGQMPWQPGFFGPAWQPGFGGWGPWRFGAWGGWAPAPWAAPWTTPTMDDEQIRNMIYDAIDADPLVPFDSDITVEVTGGVVTLRGTVPNKRIKHAVGDDAWWIPGVIDVNNQIQVTGRRRERRPAEAQGAGRQPTGT